MIQDHETSGPSFNDLLARIAAREHLSSTQARAAFDAIISAAVPPVQVAALLLGLRVKGETPEEIAGAVEALRAAMIPVRAPDPDSLVDTCGTGGGAVTTFNISTAAALLAAAAGARIAKHGNRSYTSRSGSADVFHALGVRIDLTPDAMAAVLDQAGIVFMFAPTLHPAMKNVATVRRELGVPTVMNVLGPLTNPAGARRQLVGVADPALLDVVAGALHQLGHLRALVVHGRPGMDEISPLGITDVIEVEPSGLRRYPLDPADILGNEERLHADDLAGASPEENAELIVAVLEGAIRGGARAAVVLNAAAALYVAGHAEDLRHGAALAARTIDEGKGTAALERLRTASLRAALSSPTPPP